MNLTDHAVGKLVLSPIDADGKVFFDDKISGFGVRCYRSGRKTWLYQFRLAGRSFKYEIGSTAKVLASKAENRGEDRRGPCREGREPDRSPPAGRGQAQGPVRRVGHGISRREAAPHQAGQKADAPPFLCGGETAS